MYAQNGLGIHYEDIKVSLTVDIKHCRYPQGQRMKGNHNNFRELKNQSEHNVTTTLVSKILYENANPPDWLITLESREREKDKNKNMTYQPNL